MKSLVPLALPLFIGGCFYTYNYYGVDGGNTASGSSSGAAVGTTGAGVSSGSGGASSSGSNAGASTGSEGATSTGGVLSTSGGSSAGGQTGTSSGGGSTAGGSFVPTFSCGPDAGWPTSCQVFSVAASSDATFPVPSPIDSVAVAPVGNGDYLVTALGDNGGNATSLLAYLVQPDGGIVPMGDAGTFMGASPTSMVPSTSMPSAPHLFAVDPNPFDQGDGAFCGDQIDCGVPFAAPSAIIQPPDTTYCPTADQLQGAIAPDGTLGFAWNDNDATNGRTFLWGVGSAGACPSSPATALGPFTPLTGAPVANPAALAIGAAPPSDGGPPLLLVGTFGSGNQNAHIDYVGVFALPGGTTVASASYGSGLPSAPGIVSVGSSALIIATDEQDGGYLMTLQGSVLQPGPKIMSACAAEYTLNDPMVACGSDCALAAWYDFPGGCSDTYQVVYAFVSPHGCGSAAAFPSYVDPEEDAYPIAVASQPGSAAVAFGQNQGSGTSILKVAYCTASP